MTNKNRLLGLCAILALLISLTVSASDWPGWRGPQSTAVADDASLPVTWSPEENVLWKIDLPGRGASSPTILGERIYLTTQMETDALHVLALDRDSGRIVWNTEVALGRMKSHDLHNMATATVVAEGNHLWALFGTGDLVGLDASGKILWRRNLQEDHGAYDILWGMGTSPLFYDGKLFVACLHQGPSYVLAIDALTGKDVWKKERDLEAKGEARDSYSSPILARAEGRTLIVVSGADHITAYNPDTGDQVWIRGGLQVPNPYGRTIAGPVATDGIVVTVASGFRNQGKVVAVKSDGRGDVTDSQVLWTCERYSPDCPSPVIYRDQVYFIRDDGIASCLDLRTGEPRWQERLFSENVKVSPVAGDDKVYFTSGQANTVVVEANPMLRILATNRLEQPTVSTPALSDGKIFVRAGGSLYAFE